MNRFKWLICVIVMAAVCCGMSGCGGGSDDVNSDIYVTCKINGTSVRIDGIASVLANYQITDGETVIQTGGQQQYRFVFIIPGKRTGSWNLGDHYLSMSVTEMDGMSVYEAATDQEDHGATLRVSVTSYGDVAEHVEGTFSGTAINVSDHSTLVISDGKFRAWRMRDVE